MWGKNHFGQLGVPFVSSKDDSAEDGHITRTDLQKRLDPQHYVAPIIAALDMPVAQIACGEEHTTILTEEGLVFCMGSNASGQVGVQVQKKPQAEVTTSTLESFRAESVKSLDSEAEAKVR